MQDQIKSLQNELKEAKQAGPRGRGGVSARAALPEARFDLGGLRKVAVRMFKGRLLVDVREYYSRAGEDEHRPGKKGIALTAEQWGELKRQVDDIDAAVQERNTDRD